jgi:hypothetical protein
MKNPQFVFENNEITGKSKDYSKFLRLIYV